MVELPAKAEVGELPPEIVAVVSLVAEILLAQRRRQIDLVRGKLPNRTVAREQRDDGLAA
ncbi:MAG TPA: hypothetical protein VNG93_13900 [Candidatus Dormibacteraeota bacterium]|nr:hypothetical protein [Candidatus Dormibacteraeota bacterium]